MNFKNIVWIVKVISYFELLRSFGYYYYYYYYYYILKSTEGTTQGDPLAMSLYATSLQPLITYLSLSSNANQCWYADDATGAGSLEELRKWLDGLNEMGPSLGYYPNAKSAG